MTGPLAVTWWGHSSVTVELGSIRIGTDPLLVDRLMHLKRYAASPTAAATQVDVVLVSHLHSDHLHLPSLSRIDPQVPIVVPRGARHLMRRLASRTVVEAVPGDRLRLAGLDIEVLSAHHDGRRHPMSRRSAPALGFRVEAAGESFWYPGDTGIHPAMDDVAAVDLAIVPIGGWGPTLGEDHMGPETAAEAVARVGARWAVPVHYGTFWPVGLKRMHPSNHHRLFATPSPRFLTAMELAPTEAVAVVPAHGERTVLHD
jgi:L-ascorbate metabolism protein UlaG (beta-lactamase superfamily)